MPDDNPAFSSKLPAGAGSGTSDGVAVLDALKKERSSLRRTVSRRAVTLRELLAFSVARDYGKIEDVFTAAEDKALQLFKIDRTILHEMLAAGIGDKEIDREVDEADDYRYKWNAIRRNVNSALKSGSSVGSFSHSIDEEDEAQNQGKKRNFTLPRLELVKFDGNVKNWINFWGQFSKIDQDGSIDNHDKFQYLIQATEKGSSARALIDSFPPSAENYPKAIRHLKDRFGRDELVIEVCVRELLNLVLSQAKEETELTTLYDKLTTQVNALETLGVTSEKYAAMLYPMVESALPEDTLRAFERSRLLPVENTSKTTGDKGEDTLNKGKTNRLSLLLEFLKREVESIQRINMARTAFTAQEPTHRDIFPTAAVLVASETNNKSCLWCDKTNHLSNECFKLPRLSLDERKDILRKKKVCPICLRTGHHAKVCRSNLKCFICSLRHNIVMCPEIGKKYSSDNGSGSFRNVKGRDDSVQQSDSQGSSTTMTLGSGSNVTLLQTIVVKIVSRNLQLTVRALIDNGAQRSYIRKDIASQLKLSPVRKEILTHCVFGGLETERRSHQQFEFIVKGLDNNFTLNMAALDEVKICGELPRVQGRDIQNLLRQHDIKLTDVGNSNTGDIALLIGADYAGLLMTGEFVQLGDLTAVKTKLGWTLQGVGHATSDNKINTLFSSIDLDISQLWSLESIGITDKPTDPTADEVLLQFEKNIQIDSVGRYEVSLPWKEGHQELLSNQGLAQKRLVSTTNRLVSTGNYEDYDAVFKEWLELGIIERVTSDDGRGHYLSHHAVVKETSMTTRIRPVFNASAKDKNGNSLNSCLEKGENLIEMIPKLLIQFRMHAIGIIADIKKAFLQISLHSKDRQYLKFLWWNDETRNNIITMQHCRVVFGLTCSPFLLAATLNHHLTNCPKDLEEVSAKLRQSFYVDNCVTSVETQEEAKEFISKSKQLMESAEFDLRGWISAPSREQSSETEIISVLGIIWNTKRDALFCQVSNLPLHTSKLTKRVLLSIAQKIFDPIGFTTPVTLLPKLILQKCWDLRCGWDDELPEEICIEFRGWLQNVSLLKNCSIPRRLAVNPMRECNRSLHVFSDASKSSYAASIFLRTEYGDKVEVSLVQAKSRVAPSKQKITIPRLELLAALIATRMSKQVQEAMNIECRVYYWTDSTVVLTWIQKNAQWAVFVQNRVNEIRKLSNSDDWHHVPGVMNPADLPSRGCDAKTLIESAWWEGPAWLKTTSWPSTDTVEDESANQELRRTAVHLEVHVASFSERFLYFSKYSKIVRTVAWILRFSYNCKKTKERMIGELNADEYKKAETTIVKILQKECFTTETLKKLDLKIVQDEEKVLRVETRLLFSQESNSYKFPMLLPSKHEVTKRLVIHKHENLHAGVSTMLASLREEFWIVGARRLARSVVKSCVRCKRFNSKPAMPPSAPLPLTRINENSYPFETTGVDMAGPLYLSNGDKCYIALFTCAVFRAIHLELVNSLSAEAFVSALRRFIARRGRVNTIYSDNGGNFQRTKSLLKELDWTQIQQETTWKKIKWVFIPPAAPWWGGWWERMVRTVKDLLKRVLGKAKLNTEELQTLLCDVEATVNARPLTYVPSGDDLMPLTPNVFLQGSTTCDVTDLDTVEEKLRGRCKHLQGLRSHLRQRFREEYLSLLVQKKRNENGVLKVGDIVLVETDTKRINWPLGRITQIMEGKDGKPRVASVKTSVGERVRPFQRLYPLEMCDT